MTLRRALLMAGAVATSPAVAAGPIEPARVPVEKTCFYLLMEKPAAASGEMFECVHPVWLTDEEKADLKKVTRDYFEDAKCLVDVKITKKALDEALTAADLEFTAPEQPVTCTVKTHKSTFDITGTFAPKVTFKGGIATAATPGLGNVKGVSTVLSWPVVYYVNHSARVTGTMALIINAYRMRRAKEAAGGKP